MLNVFVIVWTSLVLFWKRFKKFFTKEPMPVVSIADQLPTELWFKVLRHLDLKSQMRAEQVCRRWLSIIESDINSKTCLFIEDGGEHSYRQFGDYKPFRFTIDGKTSVVSIEDFLRSTAVRNQIRINFVQYFKYRTAMSRIIANYPNLRKLYICLMNCPMKKNILLMVSTYCTSRDLVHISVIGDDAELVVTEAEVFQFCQRFPKIKTFQMEAFSLLIKEQTIATMLENWPDIQVFILMSLLSNSETELEVETYDGEAFRFLNPNIRYLKIPGFVFTEDAIQAFGRKNPKQLTHLKIFDLEFFEAMGPLGRQYQCITSFYCSSFGDFEDIGDGIRFFSDISQLVNLKKLYLLIDSDIPMGFEALKHLKRCKQLRTIIIESTPLTVDAIEAIARYVPQLKTLELTYIRLYPEEDHNHWVHWVSQMPALEKVRFSEVTDQSFVQLITECVQLSHIDVTRANQLTISCVDRVIEAAKQRPNRFLTCGFDSKLKSNSLAAEAIPTNLKLYFLHMKTCAF